MSTLKQYIRSYFGILSPEDLQAIMALFIKEELKKGEYFVAPDTRCTKLAFVENGYIRMYGYYEGREITQWIAGSGYFVVDLQSFISETKARFCIQALTDSSIYTISRMDYMQIPKWIDGWLPLEKQFLIRCSVMMEMRIFGHLAMSAEERYLKFYEENTDMFNQIPLQYIASMLGMTPETFSRMRRKLQKLS
jgi:CRP-like cAMP-binding protein